MEFDLISAAKMKLPSSHPRKLFSICGYCMLIFVFMQLGACGGGGGDATLEMTTDTNTGISLPRSIQAAALPAEGTLSAFTTVDGGARQAMTIVDNQATLFIAGLSLGDHSFVIEFEFDLPGAGIFILATATQSMNIGAGSNTLSYAEEDYTLPDDDGDGISNLDEVSNNAPVADAGPDRSVVFGDTVILNGGSSSDVDGDALTFQWSLITLPTGSTATLSDPAAVTPTFVVDVPGDDETYVAQLIVNDGFADSEPDTVIISTGNVPPVADAGADQTRPAGDTVTLDGSASSDVNGDALTYQWSLTVPLGSTATLSDPSAVTPTFVVDVAGDGVSYIAELIVNDGQANSETDTVTINTVNTAPVANAGVDQSGRLAGEVILLDGSESRDIDGDVLTYSWSLTPPAGSAATLSNSSAVMPTFVVDRVGTYVAQLVVNDGRLTSDPDTVSITVPSLLTEACRDILAGESCRTPAGFVCVSIRYDIVEQRDEIATFLQAEGISFRSSADIPGSPTCVGWRPDLGGTEAGANCLVSLLNQVASPFTYAVEDRTTTFCRSDGFVYNIYTEEL